jgi:Tfp pilus assembly protein PilX
MSTLFRPVANRPHQRGAATLVVVMMLFLVMALLAAYANRSVLFEQRVSNSYYRAAMSQEMAEAAIEWTVAMLNGTATDAQCKPVQNGGIRFADRYLKITPEDRGTQQNATKEKRQSGIVADCAWTAEGWACRCPNLGDRDGAPAAVDSALLVPSFGITILPAVDRAGAVQINAYGCTHSVVDSCGGAAQNSKNYQAVSLQHALLALVSSVRSPPAAPLVAKGNVTSTGAGLGLHNTDPRSAGLLVTAGGTLNGLVESRLESVPGTLPGLAQISGDRTLKAADADVFRMFLGATSERYSQHPSLRKVTCNGACETALDTAYKAGKRIIWIDGPLTISSNVSLGSATDPVVIIATGNVSLTGSFQLTGLLATLGDLSWTNAGGLSLITGAVVVQGNVQTSGSMDIFYQPAVMDQLRNRVGSYVRVPGSWTDAN